MPKYRVVLFSKIDHRSEVHVSADTIDAARAAAMERAEDNDVDWDLANDFEVTDITFGDVYDEHGEPIE